MSTNQKKNRSKKIGNLFENKIAKLLGEWWFGDKHSLIRHGTSGAIKEAWIGDIVPQKLIPWNGFPFLIECKSGYKDSYPNLLFQTKLKNWIKEYSNQISSQQFILFLITSYKKPNPVLTIRRTFDYVEWNSAIIVDGCVWYNYNLNYLVKHCDFYKITENWKDIKNIIHNS
jgi:hypothetical protein